MLIKLLKEKGVLNMRKVETTKALRNNEKVSSLYLRKVINDVLKKECYINKDSGRYEICIEADYRDSLEKSVIEKILSHETSEKRMEAFNEYIYDVYYEAEESIIDYIIRDVQDKLKFMELEYCDIRDSIIDMIDIEYPHKHFLKSKVRANLIIDTGDGNSDFTLNSPSYMEDDIDNESSIKWLSNQQGYSDEELKKSLFDKDYEIKDEFLKSICQELIDTTTSMNALTFLIDATLEDVIDFDLDKIESITVSKNTNCGLIDYWYGAGGSIGINLNKDVVVPRKFIDSFTVDGNRGSYGIDAIYCMGDEEWNGNITIKYE